MPKRIAWGVIVVGMAACSAQVPLPAAVDSFCRTALNGDISGPSGAFNASDVVRKGVPSRRILGYRIDGSSAYLWYEHGGRGYHQHLVRFSPTLPNQLEESYIFPRRSGRGDIEDLIGDQMFLRDHLARTEEL